MAIVSMKALLESGVHFGHRTHKWNPKMKPYIFTERNSIHIIDLQKTVKALNEAYNLVRDTVAEGGTVLFVGTKRQAQETIQDEATRAGMPYVTMRWLGGMLTNWNTIRQRVNELERLERMRDKGEFDLLTKKEALILSRKIERLETLLGGIRGMGELPNLLFAVDVRREDTAIHEANLLSIPVVAMVDTNCDPRNVDYVIPSNDDAIRAIKLLVGKIADAVVEGKAMRKDEEEELAAAAAAALVVREAEDEKELTDEELLGEATLAKISSQAEAREIEETVDEQVVEAEELSHDLASEEEPAESIEAAADVEVEEEAEAVEAGAEAVESEAVEDIEAAADVEVEEKAEAVEAGAEAVESEAVEEIEAAADVEVEEEVEAVESEAIEDIETAADVEVEEKAEAVEAGAEAVESEAVEDIETAEVEEEILEAEEPTKSVGVEDKAEDVDAEEGTAETKDEESTETETESSGGELGE